MANKGSKCSMVRYTRVGLIESDYEGSTHTCWISLDCPQPIKVEGLCSGLIVLPPVLFFASEMGLMWSTCHLP